jgi:hypothetical protein
MQLRLYIRPMCHSVNVSSLWSLETFLFKSTVKCIFDVLTLAMNGLLILCWLYCCCRFMLTTTNNLWESFNAYDIDSWLLTNQTTEFEVKSNLCHARRHHFQSMSKFLPSHLKQFHVMLANHKSPSRAPTKISTNIISVLLLCIENKEK